jgi:hypothetical protein
VYGKFVSENYLLFRIDILWPAELLHIVQSGKNMLDVAELFANERKILF